jgi:hypothetical protein
MKEQVIDTDGQVLTKTTKAYNDSVYRNTEGRLHRIGGPAIIRSNGTQAYWVDGKRHRTDGPAVIYLNGNQEYYVDDVEYTEDEYPKAVLAYKLKQLVG